MARRRGKSRRGGNRCRCLDPPCRGDVLLCPRRYGERDLRQAAERLNVVLGLARARHFPAIAFLLDLWKCMRGISFEEILSGHRREPPRRA